MRVLCFVLLLTYAWETSAQGDHSFTFLDVPTSVFLAGIGGLNVSRSDRDNNLITSNPALVSSEMHGHLGLSFIGYPGQIKVSNVTYSSNVGNNGIWTANIVYFNYGEINAFDDTGASIGKFKSSDYAVTIGKSHQVGHFRLGGNLKIVGSQIAGYGATGLAADIGGSFIHPASDFVVGLVMKNIGAVVSDYTLESNSKMPFDVQVGTSFKPLHMPFRFSLSIYDLTQWSKNTLNLEDKSTADEVLFHTIWGLEMLIGKYVNILFGYDHKKRQELKIATTGSGSGFSYGILIGVNAFEFGYSRASYHVAGAANTFTLRTELTKLVRNKKTIEN